MENTGKGETLGNIRGKNLGYGIAVTLILACISLYCCIFIVLYFIVKHFVTAQYSLARQVDFWDFGSRIE